MFSLSNPADRRIYHLLCKLEKKRLDKKAKVKYTEGGYEERRVIGLKPLEDFRV